MDGGGRLCLELTIETMDVESDCGECHERAGKPGVTDRLVIPAHAGIQATYRARIVPCNPFAFPPVVPGVLPPATLVPPCTSSMEVRWAKVRAQGCAR